MAYFKLLQLRFQKQPLEVLYKNTFSREYLQKIACEFLQKYIDKFKDSFTRKKRKAWNRGKRSQMAVTITEGLAATDKT